MRFAADSSSGDVVASTGCSSEAVCFACGTRVECCESDWVHEKGTSCRLNHQQVTLTEMDTRTAKDAAPLVPVRRYSPAFLDAGAVIYLAVGHIVRTEDVPSMITPLGFETTRWSPGPVAMFVDSEARPRWVIILKKEIHEAVQIDTADCLREATVTSLMPALGPLGETARTVLQKFHRVGLLHFDPTSDTLPRWRAICAPPGGGKTTLLLDIVRAWPKRQFLLVTFAKDIAEELRHRAQTHPDGAMTNLRVKTLDALCYAAEIDTSGSSTVMARLNDREVVQACWPRCQPWFKKKGAAGVGPLLEHALRWLPGDMQVHQIPLCSKHEEFRWIMHSVTIPTPPVGSITRMRASFAAMRARTARDRAGVERLQVAAGPSEVLLIDEAQDLSPQALQILAALDLPTLAVGDPRQRVYGYTDSRACAECVSLMEATVPPHAEEGFAAAPPEHTMPMFETHRLDPLSCQVVDEWTLGRLGMVSTRLPVDFAPIRLVASAPDAPEPMLLLVRSNREVVAAARGDQTLRVVGGASLAGDLRHSAPKKGKRRGRDRLTAVESMALELVESGHLETVCTLLEARDAPLSAAIEGRVVSTVHRCKGSQAPHVTVAREVLFPTSDALGDFCVAVVAATRHTCRLNILESRPRHPRECQGELDLCQHIDSPRCRTDQK